jgi:hypothetical protein
MDLFPFINLYCDANRSAGPEYISRIATGRVPAWAPIAARGGSH